MSLSPDTPPTSALDMRHAAMQPAPRVATSEQKSTPFDETMAVTDFQRLLDTPSVDDSPNEPLLIESATATPLADEETLEIAIEASAWLTSQAVEIPPSVELESVSAFSAQTTVSALNMTQHAVIDSALTLATNETLAIQTHTEAEALPPVITQAVENTPLMFVPTTPHGTEILANSAIAAAALNPTAFALFLPSESMTASSSLPVPDVHHADFEKNIATHLTWLADKSIGQAHIRVTPPHLGTVEIKLNLHNQHLHAAFFSPHSEVCQRLQESLPALQRLLDEHGLHLAQADVQQQTADSDTPPDRANTPDLPTAAQQNGADNEAEITTWQTEHYSHTTLLDTWA